MPIVKRVADIPKTEQGILEYALDHLKKQGAKASEPGSHQCLYRTEDGKSCAVGCLIPHSRMKYVPTSISVGIISKKALGPQLLPHLDLLQDLQGFHDQTWLQCSNEWQLQEIKTIAYSYDLELPSWVPEWILNQEEQNR